MREFTTFALALLLAGCGEKKTTEESPDVPSAAQVEVAPPPGAPIMEERQSIASPLSDGWETEAIAESAAVQLKALAERVVAGRAEHESVAELNRYFRELDPAFTERHAEVHVFDIQLGEGEVVRTRASFEGRARKPSGIRPPSAELGTKILEGKGGMTSNIKAAIASLVADWRRSGDELELVSISTRDVQLSGGRRWFTDRTGAVLSGNASFTTHLAGGLNHWLERVERLHGMDAFIRNGLAIGDANGDGLDDVYLCQPGGLPNRLFLHRPEGNADDRSAECGVDYLDHTSSALFLDLDNDGDQDLALAVPAGLLLLENAGNEGDAKFSERGVLRTDGSDVHALAAADYDLDGNVDLYLTFALSDREPGDDTPQFVYHDANDGGPNQLFRNDGGWSFSEVTAQTGLDQNNTRHSLAASWGDFDLDGDPDLYVANDYGQNNLYRNDLLDSGARRFTDIAVESGAVDFGSGMSVSWGDYDRDGTPDLYVGNMFSNAGHRITAQEKFSTGGDAKLRALYRRFAKGNSLFRGVGGGRFEEAGAAAGVERGRWAWSSLFADLDHDGWEDLFVANGYISGDGAGDL